MGGTQSNQNHYSHAQLSISAEKAQYCNGEIMRGYVQLQVTGKLNCSDVTVSFQVFPNQEAQAGALYQFPFELAVPHDAPPSCHTGRGFSSAAIVYVLNVLLRRPGCTSFDVQQTVPIDVLGGPPAFTQDCGRYITDTQAVNYCCCFSQGQISLAGRLENGIYANGDAVTLSYEIKNESTAKVDWVSAAVHRGTRFSARGRHAHFGSECQHLLLVGSSSDTSGNTTPAIAAQPTDKGSAQGTAPPSGSTTVASAVQFPLQVVDDLPTVQSSTINISYYLSIRVKTPMCITDPSVSIPIYVKRRAPRMEYYETMIQDIFDEGGMPDPNRIAMLAPYAPQPGALSSPQAVAPQWLDTTGDGQIDSVGYDTTGDGRVDTLSPLEQHSATAPPISPAMGPSFGTQYPPQAQAHTQLVPPGYARHPTTLPPIAPALGPSAVNSGLDDFKFCSQCGTKQGKMDKFCGRCGAQTQ
ncbi:hypothetical protein CYMTET_40847 [Cymbomonas tetramitiformis]|uniref:Arrestin C-terminal-like domain-containing protein n=1 Tax=Cymbomonas tetramitiformis TaxID=36881 RepID=A0AAE0C7C0_9CHLO|nr:hypothetical protein CYMTET_40848 [Cymbomonas tetramitiformis]KAK3249739.1 hypothetical protein CYMTET_40847 [Cymbomonas tetramitiformis]